MTYPLNTIIRLPDGRVGTVCYNMLQGCGGVWGRHAFVMPENPIGDGLPPPDFLLRERCVQAVIDRYWPTAGDAPECVGEACEVVSRPEKEAAK